MATTQTAFAPAPIVSPFTGLGTLSETVRASSPRSEVTYSILAGAVTVGAVGEDQRVFINCILPINFAYVVVDCFVRLLTADAADWGVVGELSCADSDSSDRTFLASQEMISSGTIDVPSTTISRVWNAAHPLLRTVMLKAPASAATRCAVSISNASLAGTAGTLDFYMRFLQFDVEQTHHVGVNWPQLTR